MAWRGMVWQARRGTARHGGVRHGAARLGKVWRGEAWQARRGLARRGRVWRGVARRGRACHGFRSSQFRLTVSISREGETKEVNNMAVYSWKFGQPVPAQVAGEYLEKLEQENGALTPELVLNESRDEKAVLHPCFEWDDGKAAESYRLYQARKIISNITVKIETSANETSTPVRAFVSISDSAKKETGNFVSIGVAMNDEVMRAQVLKNALYELQTFKRKYAAYSELQNIFNAIDELETKLPA